MGLGSCQTYLLGRPHKGGCYGPPVRAPHDEHAPLKCVSLNLSLSHPQRYSFASFDRIWFDSHIHVENPKKVDGTGKQFDTVCCFSRRVMSLFILPVFPRAFSSRENRTSFLDSTPSVGAHTSVPQLALSQGCMKHEAYSSTSPHFTCPHWQASSMASVTPVSLQQPECNISHTDML